MYVFVQVCLLVPALERLLDYDLYADNNLRFMAALKEHSTWSFTDTPRFFTGIFSILKRCIDDYTL